MLKAYNQYINKNIKQTKSAADDFSPNRPQITYHVTYSLQK